MFALGSGGRSARNVRGDTAPTDCSERSAQKLTAKLARVNDCPYVQYCGRVRERQRERENEGERVKEELPMCTVLSERGRERE